MTIQSLSPQAAFEFIQAQKIRAFIDVRSSMEFLFVGHPLSSVNIPWIDEPNWDVNPNFCADIEQHVQYRYPEIDPKTVPVILICRSGVRSLDAGAVLVEAGFKQIYNVLEGFEGELDDDHHRCSIGGWRFHQLPWVQC